MSVYWDDLDVGVGVYTGFCGPLSLGNVFLEWYSYTQEQKFARRLLRAGGHQVNRQTSSMEHELSPRADQDNEEVGPHHEWPDTDDGF